MQASMADDDHEQAFLQPLVLPTSYTPRLQNPHVSCSSRPSTARCPPHRLSSAPANSTSPELCPPSRGRLQSWLLASRDKESLIEEIMFVKKALVELADRFRMHKVYACSLREENRKLEKDVADLEIQKCQEGRRTGGAGRLRAKLLGIKMKLAELQETCYRQNEELHQLRHDVRVARTRELEFERDVFADELQNMQKLMKRLGGLYKRMSNENAQLSRLKEKNACLEHAIKRFGCSFAAVNEKLEKASSQLAAHRCKAKEWLQKSQKSEKVCKENSERAAMLEEMLSKEKMEKQKIEKRVRALEEEVRKKASKGKDGQVSKDRGKENQGILYIEDKGRPQHRELAAPLATSIIRNMQEELDDDQTKLSSGIKPISSGGAPILSPRKLPPSDISRKKTHPHLLPSYLEPLQSIIPAEA